MDKRFTCVALSLLCAAAILPTGCRSTPSGLADATDKAERLYDRAVSLLNDTPYQFDNKFAPFSKKVDIPADEKQAASSIGLASPGEINPQVDEAINKAIDGLTKALAAPEGATEADKVAAQIVLARLYALRGYRLSLSAAEKRREASEAASAVESGAANISGLGKRVGVYDEMLSVGDENLQKLVADTKARITGLDKQITDTESKIAGLEKDKAGLASQNETLMSDSRELMVRCNDANAVDAVDLFDQAKTLEVQAGVNSAKMVKIEDSIQTLKSEIVDYKASKDAAETLLAKANEMTGTRQTNQTDLEKGKQEMVAKLTAAQKQAEADAAKVVEMCKAATADQDKALEAYGKAIDTYQAYDNATKKYANDTTADPALRPDAAVIAMMGDARMSRGDVRVRALLLQRRLDEVAEDASKIWAALPTQNAVPAVIGEMKQYLTDTAGARDKAQEDFRWAAKAYVSAKDAVKDSQLKWAYVLDQAAANVRLYRISGNPAAKEDALKSLDSLGAAEGSPLISPTAEDFRSKLAGPPLFGSEG